MPDKKGNLYIHEAILIRGSYDSHMDLLRGLVQGPEPERGAYGSSVPVSFRKPAADFERKKMEESLKKLQVKRLKLNAELQKANFTVTFDFEGNKISIAEALEMRRSALEDVQRFKEQSVESAFDTVIYKEERDIVKGSGYSFIDSYKDYLESLKRLRELENAIHEANHSNTVSFKNE